MTTRRPSPWQALPNRIRVALGTTWRMGVPPEAMALYGRWWQLETWLRSLIYVELRARDGVGWAAALPPTAEERETKDRRYAYMATPDAQARLAYLDLSPLLDLLEKHWPLFTDSLIDWDVWSGRTVELRSIRNRIGHCRRPHSDDLARLEQTLRDLESGTFRAVAAFNRQHQPVEDLDDPLVEAWVRDQHQAAVRLVRHADQQYEVRFALRFSRRPWAEPLATISQVTGKVGYLWHAVWYIRSGFVDLRKLWQDIDHRHDLLVFLCANSPAKVEVSFAAVDNPQSVADAIGACFDALLYNQRRGKIPDQVWKTWEDGYDDLDPRVQVNSPWPIIDDSTVPVSMFGA
jgi:Swt1-like HEPN